MSRVKNKAAARQEYVVDWQIEGSFEVLASGPEEAQDLFAEFLAKLLVSAARRIRASATPVSDTGGSSK